MLTQDSGEVCLCYICAIPEEGWDPLRHGKGSNPPFIVE